MPSNMVLPVYSGDKNKEGELRKVVANRLLHLRLCFGRYKLPIVIMLAIVVLFVVVFSPHLPTATSDVATQARPDLKVGIGQKDGGEQPPLNPDPVVKKDDGTGTGAGLELPSAQQQEKLRQEEMRKNELAEQKAAEERAAAERAAAEAQHQADGSDEQQGKLGEKVLENNANADGNGNSVVNNKASVEPLPVAGNEAHHTAGMLTPDKGENVPIKLDTGVWPVPDEHQEQDATAREHQTAVREAFLHAWHSYEKFAWGYDELRPQSRQGMNWLSSGLGATIVDSLSTMHVMGLKDEFNKARNWVKDSLPAQIESV